MICLLSDNTNHLYPKEVGSAHMYRYVKVACSNVVRLYPKKVGKGPYDKIVVWVGHLHP